MTNCSRCTVLSVICFDRSAAAGVLAVILQQLDCSLGYVYEIMGVLIGSAVIPVAMCLMWRKTNKWGAICGAVGGQWLGLISWVLFAKARLQISLPVCLLRFFAHLRRQMRRELLLNSLGCNSADRVRRGDICDNF